MSDSQAQADEQTPLPKKSSFIGKGAKTAGKGVKLIGWASLPVGLTMAAGAVFPPAGFIVPVCFMAGGWIKTGYKIHKENIKIGEDIPKLSISDAAKKGIQDKFDKLKGSYTALANPFSLVKQERLKAEINGETIGRVRGFFRAVRENKYHIAVVGGAAAGLALKAFGLGDGIGDGISTLFEDAKDKADSTISAYTDGAEGTTSADGTDNDGTESTSEYDRAPTQIPVTADYTPASADGTSAPDIVDTGAGADGTGTGSGEGSEETTTPDNPDTDDTDSVNQTPLTDEDKIEIIEKAGLPYNEELDLDTQLRMAELLPDIHELSGENQQYFSEMYERMDSDNPMVQAQAYKDYADLALNCLGGIEGVENEALAFDVISMAVEAGQGTNCQAMDFQAYMMLHGIGTEVDVEAATNLYLDSLANHESVEAYNKLLYLGTVVDLDQFPRLAAVMESVEASQETASAPEPDSAQMAEPETAPASGSDYIQAGEEITIQAGNDNEIKCTAKEDISVTQAGENIGRAANDYSNVKGFTCDL